MNGGVARRVVSILLSLVVLAASLVAAAVGVVWGLGLQCDESCDDRSTRWPDDPDAWQWTLLGCAGIACLFIAVALLVAVAMRRPPLAGGIFLAWGTASVVFAALVVRGMSFDGI